MISGVAKIKVLIPYLVLCVASFSAVEITKAETPVSIELVLAVDTSLSVGNFEYNLQMKGIAEALRTPEITELITLQDGVAITVIQWSGWSSEKDLIVWRLLGSRESIRAYANEVEAMERQQVGYFTAIGSAIEASLQALETNTFKGKFMKIDISGDGMSNAGPDPNQSRILAAYRGVTVNGLAILTDTKDLDEYYRKYVITGNGAFVVAAADYLDFARAIHLKLLRELAPAVSLNKLPGDRTKIPGNG